jgi:hypothetical protein
MVCRVLLFILLTAVPLSLHAASPVKARSLSGSGLLLLGDGHGATPSRLVLYREPGLGRIAELDTTQLPPVAPAARTENGQRAAVVTAKKLDWYRIVYDGSERQGWLRGRPAYRYQRWGELLPGRNITVPAGLKKDFYLLRSEPDSAAPPLDTIGRESRLTVLGVAGDWINVRQDVAVSGWLRWRDDNGRLLIAVDYRTVPVGMMNESTAQAVRPFPRDSNK